jgi:hypothetical protein
MLRYGSRSYNFLVIKKARNAFLVGFGYIGVKNTNSV